MFNYHLLSEKEEAKIQEVYAHTKSGFKYIFLSMIPLFLGIFYTLLLVLFFRWRGAGGDGQVIHFSCLSPNQSRSGSNSFNEPFQEEELESARYLYDMRAVYLLHLEDIAGRVGMALDEGKDRRKRLVLLSIVIVTLAFITDIL